MTPSFIGLLGCFSAFFRSRYSLSLEILALRQQLGILKRKQPRPRLQIQDRIFWILLRRLWPAWSHVLVIVKPETVFAWHRFVDRQHTDRQQGDLNYLDWVAAAGNV
jgi:hypothetical protein